MSKYRQADRSKWIFEICVARILVSFPGRRSLGCVDCCTALTRWLLKRSLGWAARPWIWLDSPLLCLTGLDIELEIANSYWILGNLQYIVGSRDWRKFPSFFQMSLIVALHSPDGRHLPAVRAVQDHCEIVYDCMHWSRPITINSQIKAI